LFLASCCSLDDQQIVYKPEKEDVIAEMDRMANEIIPAMIHAVELTNSPEYIKEQNIFLKGEVKRLKRELADELAKTTACQISITMNRIIHEVLKMIMTDELKICEMEKDAIEDSLKEFYPFDKDVQIDKLMLDI